MVEPDLLKHGVEREGALDSVPAPFVCVLVYPPACLAPTRASVASILASLDEVLKLATTRTEN